MNTRAPLLCSLAASLSLLAISAHAEKKEHVEVDLSKLPPASKKAGLTYAKDVRPLFEASCFRCHGEEKQKGKLRLDSLEAVLKGSEDGKVVEPGNSAKSSLVVAVSGLDPESAMPPKKKPGGPGGPGGDKPGGPGGPGGAPGAGGPGHPPGAPAKPLTAEEVGVVRAWIDQGAK